PSETSRTSPRRPTLTTSSRRMTFIRAPFSIRRNVGEQGDGPRPLDGVGQLPLVPRTTARDPPGDDLAAFGDEVAEPADILIVDEIDLVRAELAALAPAEPPTLDGLLRRGNGSLLPG